MSRLYSLQEITQNHFNFQQEHCHGLYGPLLRNPADNDQRQRARNETHRWFSHHCGTLCGGLAGWLRFLEAGYHTKRASEEMLDTKADPREGATRSKLVSGRGVPHFVGASPENGQKFGSV